MKHPIEIEAIFLDIGNTMRIVIEDPEFQAQARQQLYDLVGATEPIDEFFEKIDVNWKAYRKQSKASLKEASERELWSKWLLENCPAYGVITMAGGCPVRMPKKPLLNWTAGVICWESLPTPLLKPRSLTGWNLMASGSISKR